MRRRQTATHPRRYSVGLGVTAGLELLSDSVDGHRARFGVEIERRASATTSPSVAMATGESATRTDIDETSSRT